MAGMLGANTIDLAVSYVLLALSRIIWICKHIRKRIVIHVALITIRAVLLPPFLLCLVYGTMFPFSEVSAGGNYNLFHMAASSRRFLSPINLDSKHLVELSTERPVSLYIQRAGFLWTESLTWVDEIGIFDVVREEHKEEPRPRITDRSGVVDSSDQDRPHRVFFAYPIARRHPWTLKKASPSTYGSELLMSGENVHARSHITGWYFSVANGRRSIVDRELGVHVPVSDSFVRFEVR